MMTAYVGETVGHQVQPMTIETDQQVLSGIRVLDLTRYEAGPTCTLFLAFLGAEVIKLEPGGSGKSNRQLFYDEQDAKEDLYFVLMNLNKKRITLDFTSGEGRQLFLDLVKCSDVLVENFGAEIMQAWGLGDVLLRSHNPRLIYASLSGYGSYGPYSRYPSMDMTAQAMGGIMSITGNRRDPPLRCGATIADSSAGSYLAMGISAALYRREKTGKGMKLEVSMQDSALNLGRALLGTHIAFGSSAHKVGNQLNDVVPWNVYRTQEGQYVAICVIRQRMFEKLMTLMGRADVVEASGLHSLEKRKINRDLIDRTVGEWVASKSKWEVMEVLCRNGIPCGAVLNSQELGSDPHLSERQMIVEIEHDQWGKLKVLGCPVKVFDAPVNVKTSPRLGEHNREVFMNLLGLDEADLQRFMTKGVI